MKHYKSLIIAAFLIPIITVAIVSISHVTKWYGISNPFSWAIYLSIGIEIAALSALAAISADMGKKVYFPFIIVTLVQFIGNIFFAYSYIDLNSQSFKDWVDLVAPIVSFMGIESTDFVGHKRFLSLFAGGMLPIISLSFLHMLVKFTEEERKLEQTVSENEKRTLVDDKIIEEAIENYKKNQEKNVVDASEIISEVSKIRLSENDLKKLEEILLNPPQPNKNLIDAAKEFEEKFVEQNTNNNEDDLYFEKKELINNIPVSKEEKTINLRQVLFSPDITQNYENTERKEILIKMMEQDQELGLYDEISVKDSNESDDPNIDPTEEEESRNFHTIEPNSENILQNNEDYPGQIEDWITETVPEPFDTQDEIEKIVTPIEESINNQPEIEITKTTSEEEDKKKITNRVPNIDIRFTTYE